MTDAPAKALSRFAAKVEFDPLTGCVLWTGGKSSGRAGTVEYGAFHFDGKRWPAHRWAGKFIHGIEMKPDTEIRHTCGNTLCVQHLEGVEPGGNTRQYWLLVSLGYEEGPEKEEDAGPEIPFDTHPVPAWLQPFIKEADHDDVPF